MRKIESNIIVNEVSELCGDINFNLPQDVYDAVSSYVKNNGSVSDDILKQILENAKIAKEKKIALCQDTGTANFFVKIGRDVEIINDDGKKGDIVSIINKGVSDGYTKYYLRKSIVSDPLNRTNTKDNTPANVYCDYVDGDKIEITMLAKGGGSENASFLKMLTPLDSWEGIKKFVIDSIKLKGANACPPIIVGVGIGGDFASVGLLAKKALLRTIGSKNIKEEYNSKEQELLGEINKLNIGPMGLGGMPTALAVFIETKPCHIASMPVALNIQCHSCRRKKITL
ncbi:MAG: fumarate hydratase [Elusimicrobia bacterium]|nr:fumarate hydratase [Elusimicrobiota bacterium]